MKLTRKIHIRARKNSGLGICCRLLAHYTLSGFFLDVQKQFNFSKREELNDPWLLLLLLLHRRRLLLTVPWFVYHPQSLPSFIFSSSSLESWLEPVSHVPKHAHNGTSSKDWSSRSSNTAQSIFMSSWDATVPQPQASAFTFLPSKHKW